MGSTLTAATSSSSSASRVGGEAVESMTISDTIALCMLLIAIVSLLANLFRSSRREAAAQQAISDQIKSVVDGLADVRKVLTELRSDFAGHGQQLAGHGQQLAAISERVASVEQRLARVEDRCDARWPGGTD